MNDFEAIKSKFSNHRQWRDFVTVVHDSVTGAVTYPKVIGALRSGRAWFNDGAARASSWLNAQTVALETLSLGRTLTQPRRLRLG
jgi:hypothetical protein